MRAAFVALAVLVVLAPPVLSQGDSVKTMKAVLPVGTEGPGAAWDGQYAYIFGGWDGTKRSDAILRYSPSTDTLLTMTAKLPTSRMGVSAVFVKGMIYVMGGYGCPDGESQYCHEVLRFDPAIDTISEMPGIRLVRALYYQAVATDGNVIYLFGGGDNLAVSRAITRFDPSIPKLGWMRTQFPDEQGRSLTTAAFDGANYYIFGGCIGSGGCSNADIWKYEPGPDRLTKVAAQLPQKNHGLSGIWDGTGVYLFGGQNYPTELDTISRFDPTTSKVTLLSARLPEARFKAAAVWTGEHAFVFGGEVQDHANEANSRRLTDIVRFMPAVASSEPTHPFVPPGDTGKKGIPGPDALVVSCLVAALALVMTTVRRRT